MRSDERILLLAIPEPTVVLGLSRQVPEGVVVALGSDEEVREARRATRDLENVMFVATTPDEIPWPDGFFTRVIDTANQYPGGFTPEILRVLAKDAVP